MVDLRDEYGNPIQLADQYGKLVQLTDEYGNPMHMKGVATSTHTAETTLPPEPPVHVQEPLRRSGSSNSSSSSSEDDGQGGRRKKKKGMKEKIKETFGGGKYEDEDKAVTTVTQECKMSSVPG